MNQPTLAGLRKSNIESNLLTSLASLEKEKKRKEKQKAERAKQDCRRTELREFSRTRLG